MKKHILFGFLSLSLMGFPLLSLGAQPSISHVGGKFVFPREFDVLALDITVPYEEDGDVLETITVRNGASQFNGLYVDKLRLYIDNGPEGFQGFGVDTDLGTATYLSGIRLYVFENLEIPISEQEGLRLFFTIESSNNYSSDGLVQLVLPRLMDRNGNGQYEEEDEGYFTSKGNNGPDLGITNASIHKLTTSTQDRIAPKTAITFPENNQVISDSTITVTGIARDGGGSNPKDVMVGIGTQEGVYTYHDVLATQGSFEEWEYIWENVEEGIYYLVTTAIDHLSNQSLPQTPIKVIVDSRFEEEDDVEEDKTPEVSFRMQREVIEGVFTGDLITTKGSDAVYYVNSSGKRMAFPNKRVYRSWYHNFLGVKEVSPETLAAISLSGLVQYRPGVQMVKITSDPKVYAIDKGGVLRWIQTEEIARGLYGEDWNQQIHDVDVTFFSQYRMGTDIASVSDYDKEALLEYITTIQDN